MYDYEQQMSRPAGPDYLDDASSGQDFFEDGWLMFSGLMIFFVGSWNAFEGGLAFFRSAFFAGTPTDRANRVPDSGDRARAGVRGVR